MYIIINNIIETYTLSIEYISLMQKLIKSKSFCFKQPATKTCVSKIKELLETKKKKTKQKKKRRSYAQTSSS